MCICDSSLITSGKRWIRTTEGKNQQIYSLPHLATLVFSQNSLRTFEPMEGIEPTTPRLQITCSGQLSYIGNKPLRDAKVGIIFNSANFSAIFFIFFLLFQVFPMKTAFLQPLFAFPLVCSKNFCFPFSQSDVGKSSANIITLSVRKK